MAFKLHNAQRQIIQDKHRFRVVNAGRKTGKSVSAVEEIIANAISGNDRNIVYIGETLKEARDVIWNKLKKRTLPIQVDKPNETRLEIEVKTQKKGTSVIYLRGWESVESLRGMEFDFMVLDEVAKFKDFMMYWQEVLRPTLTPRKGSALFISTPRGFNHFYDLYNLEKTDKNYKSFHFTTYDNPYIPPEEIEEAKQQMTEDRFAQEYLAEFKKMEGLVYKEFDRFTTVIKEDPKNIKSKFAGVDFGFTNPAAIITIHEDFDSKFYIVDEFYKTHKTEDEIADYIKSLDVQYVYPDPENASAIEVLRRNGVNVREVKKGKGSIPSGINTVRELLKQGRLFVHERCVNTINEFETYHYPDNDKEIPVKESDHAMDAIRYALSMKTTRIKPQIYREPRNISYQFE